MESVFFFPIILPMAIVAIVWGMLLNTDMGVINGLLTPDRKPKMNVERVRAINQNALGRTNQLT